MKDKKSPTKLLKWRHITLGYENNTETWQLCGLDITPLLLILCRDCRKLNISFFLSKMIIEMLKQWIEDRSCTNLVVVSFDLWHLDFSIDQFWHFKVSAFDLTFTLKYNAVSMVRVRHNYDSENQEMHSHNFQHKAFPIEQKHIVHYIKQWPIVI